MARRLLLKMIRVAEALRRSSTYCEVNHLSSHCTAISPRGDARQSLQAPAPFGDSCSLLLPPSSTVINGSIVALRPGARGAESRWSAPFFVSWRVREAGSDRCPTPCSALSDAYLQLRGCCAAVEEYALVNWWASVRHPRHSSFLLQWPDGWEETFHVPDFECGKGGKLLSECVMNHLCGKQNFLNELNFPSACCTGEMLPTCCSLRSPLTGNLTICQHGEQHRAGDCWCRCELGFVGRLCDKTDIHVVFDLILSAMSAKSFLASKQMQIRQIFSKLFVTLVDLFVTCLRRELSVTSSHLCVP